MGDRDTSLTETQLVNGRRAEIARPFGDAETRYRILVERGPAITYVDAMDQVSSTVYISPQVEILLGYSQEEWLADPALWAKVVHPEDRERVMAENERTNRTGEPFNMEYQLVT